MSANSNVYSQKEYLGNSRGNEKYRYDANGNMTADLDRDIVTIKYNLLYLPELIQFKNGSQILNSYDAAGTKFESRFITCLVTTVVPLGDVSNIVYGIGINRIYKENRTYYCSNYEYIWDSVDGIVSRPPVLSKIHNIEGYKDGQDINNDILHYFRRDHLGNVRDVWKSGVFRRRFPPLAQVSDLCLEDYRNNRYSKHFAKFAFASQHTLRRSARAGEVQNENYKSMKIKYTLYFIILLFFYQCKTSELSQMKRDIMKSYPVNFLNKSSFNVFRALMFDKLSPDILKNDTIIIMEYFVDVKGSYSCTIYESNDKSINRYVTTRNIKKGKRYADSLRVSDVPDKILELVLENKLDEIKRRGDASMITPTTTLIINIGVKKKEKDKFDFTTLKTREFSTYRDGW